MYFIEAVCALCWQEYDYFGDTEEERIKMLAEVDKLSELLSLSRLVLGVLFYLYACCNGMWVWNICLCGSVHTCVCVCVCLCVCMCVHTCVCVCAYMCVCVCILACVAYMYVQDCVNLWCLAGFKSCTFKTKIIVFGESAICEHACVNVSEWTMVFGSSSVKPALELFEKQSWRNCIETGLYWAHRDHQALNWSVVCMSGELKVCVDASKWWCLCLTT